jgi:Uma2 family endonuclease
MPETKDINPANKDSAQQSRESAQQHQQPKGKAEVYDYTYFASLPEGMPVELIDGQVFSLSPASNYRHQKIGGFIFRKIGNYLEDKEAEVFFAPFDVFLVNDGQDIMTCKNIVHPDIIVVSDKKKMLEKGYKGSPDLIIEIISQSTKNRDYIQKLALYGEYGVKEYWIVNPKSLTISIYKADENGFSDTDIYTFNEKVKVGVLGDLEIDFSGLFAKIKGSGL